jgi:hypothetical protein
MKKFFIYIIFFLTLSAGLFILGAYATSIFVGRFEYKNHETESNLFLLNSGKSRFSYAIIGNSHARNFSRYHNHERMEEILGGSVLNLGKGNAECGANELHFYLDYFYSKGVRIDTLLYVMSPPLLYGGYLNRASNTFKEEPLRWDFLIQYLFYPSENKWQRVFYYLRSKLRPDWLLTRPESKNRMDRELLALDSSAVSKIFSLAYLDDNSKLVIQKNSELIEKTIELSFKYQTKIILFIPPALFGKWRGHEQTVDFCEKMKNKYKIPYFDFSMSVLDPKYYYDHHHLNTNGIVYFGNNYLKPGILSINRTEDERDN